MTFGFDGTTVTSKLRITLQTIQPGGIILFSRNIEDTRQTHALLKDSQAFVDTRMFLCVDMEGGTVDRLKDIVAPAPSAAEVFATGNKKVFREHGRVIGEECAALGFNSDFAPVSDLGFDISKKVLTTRTVSPDPEETVAYVQEFIRGLKDVKVLGCGKHFPGLGEADLDTHKELPSIKKPWKDLWEEDLYPYRKINNKFPFVMVAHAAYPEVTKDKAPASLSKKWITDILRKKIGYKGLIISDDLEMGGAMAVASIEEAAVETIRAGADIYLVCHNEEYVWRTYNAVLREAEKNARFRAQVETAAKRILNFKKKSAEINKRFPTAPSEATISKLRQKLWKFSEEIRVETVGSGPV